MIPMRVSGMDQQEVMRLLCRVHQLEIENLESQSASLLRDFQIKKKDMVISRFHQHRNLVDDIIRRQRDLMDGECCESILQLFSFFFFFFFQLRSTSKRELMHVNCFARREGDLSSKSVK